MLVDNENITEEKRKNIFWRLFKTIFIILAAFLAFMLVGVMLVSLTGAGFVTAISAYFESTKYFWMAFRTALIFLMW